MGVIHNQVLWMLYKTQGTDNTRITFFVRPFIKAYNGNVTTSWLVAACYAVLHSVSTLFPSLDKHFQRGLNNTFSKYPKDLGWKEWPPNPAEVFIAFLI